MSIGVTEFVGPAESKIRRHFEVFQHLLESSEDFAARGDFAAAAAYAQIAASHAYRNHGGLWSSSRLEAVLGDIGESLSYDAESRHWAGQERNEAPHRILHVMTTAYSIGGHTRMVWRWIQQDRRRSHSVAITQQGTTPVPGQLMRAVSDAGGKVHFADENMGGVLCWAQKLRDLALQFDQVVLHMHPYDVLPVIAFAGSHRRPPLVYVNHADHVFWLGISISDVVAHLRESGLTISTGRRGIQEERCVVIPVPLNRIERRVSRAQAKKELGIPPDATVLFSIADAYKFEPILGETSFVDALLPVLRRYPNAWLIVVGPGNEGQWAKGSRESMGRIKAYGRRSDGAAFYQATDIYLDPFPFASTTSFLEAGSYELPLVSFCPLSNEALVLCADSPELTQTMVRAKDLDEYRAKIGELVENPELRVRLGQKTRHAILKAHVGDGWIRKVDRLYASAAEISPMGRHTRQDLPDVSSVDVRLASIFDKPHMSRDVNAILLDEAGLLPLGERLKAWTSQPNGRLRVLHRFLLSAWMRTSLRRLISGSRRKISPEAVVP